MNNKLGSPPAKLKKLKTYLKNNNTTQLFLIKSLALTCIFVALTAGCEKYTIDAKIRELCAKDGGINIYETATLPDDEFNEFGQASFITSKHGSVLLENYELIEERHTYESGDPKMLRIYIAVRRKMDKKILGESVGYVRIGDGFEGPFHPSWFVCPDGFNEVSLIKKIFISYATKPTRFQEGYR